MNLLRKVNLSSTQSAFIILTLLLMNLLSCSSISSDLDSFYTLSSSASSMSPTFPPDTILGIDEDAYKASTPQRGDIVLIKHPQNELLLLKRVIGLPSEHIEIRDHLVWIDGNLLFEPYIENPPLYRGEWQIDKNSFFVLGDNRNASADSHMWGSIPAENIVGKAISLCQNKFILSCNETIESPDYGEKLE